MKINFKRLRSNPIYIVVIILLLLSSVSSRFFAEDTVANALQNQHSIEFKYEKSLQSHFKKHGIKMGFASAAEYVARANEVIKSDKVLSTIQDDSDTAYFLKSTGEFVVVSHDGYLRTFFIPEDGIRYFNKQ